MASELKSITRAELENVSRPGLSQKQAMYLLKTIWPDAPEAEIVKAALICYQYRLNPLMKQIYIVGFNNKGGGKTYSTILGIQATRQIAQQNGRRYSYSDGPRVMTADEQKTIFGFLDETKIWAITKVKDGDGNEYPGYGFWQKDLPVHGGDKGNTPLNMAFIRSERNALDKMAPGALPQVDVADEAYTPVNMSRALEEGKVSFIEQTERDVSELWGTQDEKEPRTIQDFFGWTVKHGKDFDATWFYQQFPHFRNGNLSSKLHEAWLEVKATMGW